MTMPMNYIGRTFGRLEVIEKASNLSSDTHSRWRCRCSCGAEEIIPVRSLTSGRRVACKKCISYRPNFKDITGKRFGKLLVKSRAENDADGNSRWNCVCDCGKEIIVSGHSLNKSKRPVKSCGCSSKTKKKKHDCAAADSSEENKKLYKVYGTMKQRCINKNSKAYVNYGQRGIQVCDEWLNQENGFIAFKNWALNNGYKIGLTLDRIDVNGNYEPANCRWVDRYTQMNNTRRTRFITYNNETKSVMDWAKQYGIKGETLYSRIFRYKWPIEDALKLKQYGGYHVKA